MYSLTLELNSMGERVDKATNLFKDSQSLRKQSIIEYKEAGKHLKNIKNIFEEANASKTNPIETDLGTFTSFNKFLKEQRISVMKAYNYLKLYERWDLVEALNILEYEACYRLNRTLAVIKWADSKLSEDSEWLSKQEFKLGNRLVTKEVENGTVSVEQATPITKLEAYWLDKPDNSKDKPSYRELEKDNQRLENMVNEYESKIKGYEENIERLEKELKRKDKNIERLLTDKEKLENKDSIEKALLY